MKESGAKQYVKQQDLDNRQAFNLGWWMNKEYWRLIEQYKNFQFQYRDEESFIKACNGVLPGKDLSIYSEVIKNLHEDMVSCASIVLQAKVSGAGWLAGVSNGSVSDKKGSPAFGLTFDHTSGLPFITGHQLKGNLKSIFNEDTDYLKYVVQDDLPEYNLDEDDDIKKIKEMLFEDACLDFLGAWPCEDLKFATAVITPSKGKTKKPVPLPFLKVAQETKFRFYFEYKSKENLDIDRLVKILIKLIKNMGVGAKKNYDFSHFKDVRQL